VVPAKLLFDPKLPEINIEPGKWLGNQIPLSQDEQATMDQATVIHVDAGLGQAPLSCAEKGQPPRWCADFRKTRPVCPVGGTAGSHLFPARVSTIFLLIHEPVFMDRVSDSDTAIPFPSLPVFDFP
jgi:hypothetical protein